MTSMTTSQSHVGCLVANVALGRDGKAFQREVERLTDHMGPEWVVNRMKVLWNAANHLRNDDLSSAQELYQSNGIAYHKGDMTPKGPFRPAVKQYALAQRPSVIKRKAAVLRFYTSVKLTSLTEKQWTKAYDAITTPSSDSVERDAIELARGHVSSSDNRVLLGKQVRSRMGEDWTPPLDDRYADQLRATSHYHSSKVLPREFKGKPYASMTLSFLDNSYVPASLDGITPNQEMRNIFRDQDPNWDLKPVGKIAALQEQGAKARVVCMPSAPLQLAFAPLHKELAQLAEKAYPDASCVRDQQRGVYGVLRHMQEGKPVFCTDLSSATDRFPRAYSIELLRQLGYGKYAEALDDVCQKPFVGPHGEILHYGTGQPMGLYGSFPLFHLSNLMVADAAERVASHKKPTALDKFQNGRTFYVLGDDVVFSDEVVSDEYRRTMGVLGVPISEHKSFKGKLAEFAGFMVTESREGFVAFRPYKVPDTNHVSNPISFLDSLGSRAARRSPYWAKQWSLFRETTGSRGLDLSPHISKDEDFGPNPYRGDSRTLVDLANSLTAVVPDLPDISNAMRASRIPLFHERRYNDYYGYSPEKLQASEKVRKDLPLGARTTQAIRDDPLMEEVRMRRESPQSSVSSRILDLVRDQYPKHGTSDLVSDVMSRKSALRMLWDAEFESISEPLEELDRVSLPDTSGPDRDHEGNLNGPTPVSTDIANMVSKKEDIPSGPRVSTPSGLTSPKSKTSSVGYTPSGEGVNPPGPRSQDREAPAFPEDMPLDIKTTQPQSYGASRRVNPVEEPSVRGRFAPTSHKKAKSDDFEL